MSSLKINPQRAAELLENLAAVRARIRVAQKTSKSTAAVASADSTEPRLRLVAVSKLKPVSDILALHRPSLPPHDHSQTPQDAHREKSEYTPQTHFGENYVQELLEKSRLLPASIKWHFIGGLQSNKCTMLARDVKGLWAVESVDSVKKAKALEKGWKERKTREKERQEGEEEQLRVFVQINTSGEESKSGVEPKSNDLLSLCRLIRDECPHLRLQGLMTIGAIARSKATTPETENEDFVKLQENRGWLVDEHGFDAGLELSMGMSDDFEGAIVQGSDEVRVGTTIFGARPPRKEAKVLEETEDGKG